MNPERWEKVREVLAQALEVAPEKRTLFLDDACESDPSLRSEVESLLSSDGNAPSSFLQFPPVSPAALTKGTKLGDYEIISLVGSGGMGEVYRARDTKLKRDVAIKVLPAYWSRDLERLERFELEARAAAALNHPNITSIFHVGQRDGTPYIVTELLQGETLRDHLRKGQMRLHEALDYGAEIARGLGAAHDAGVIHRDLKPENIFVTKDGRIKLLDFGLAKFQAAKSAKPEDPTVIPRQTNPGQVLGTVGYMSPEQVRGQSTDARTDIFAVGAVLYEMLTGKPAFRKATSVETMSAILNEDPPAVSQVAPNLPPGLQRIVNRCLAKNPEQRFQHASDVAFALEAISDSGSASGPAVTQRPSAKVAKKWLATGLAITAALALGLGWFFSRHRPTDNREIVQRQLTFRSSDHPLFNAIISRDGKHLAYSDKDGISIQDIDTGKAHRLPGTIGLYTIDWYPDGLHLLAWDLKFDLWDLALVSGEKRKLASGIYSARLSPDGSQIAYLRQQSRRELWTMPVEGGEPTKRLATSEDERFCGASWSPDSKAIAYVRMKNADTGGAYNTGASLDTKPIQCGILGWSYTLGNSKGFQVY